jgi:hypothetical protein
MGENKQMVLLFIDFLEERDCVEKLERMKNRHLATVPFLHASNAEKPYLLLQSQLSAETGPSETMLGLGLTLTPDKLVFL